MQRAEQCETVAPVAAYYTRLAGVTKGTSFSPMHPDIKAVCIAMMGALEKAKSKIGITGPDGDPQAFEASIEELRTFALTVFGIADRTDQLGARDNKLVLKYMSAGTFLQALATVYPSGLSPKEAELLRYCRVRSVELSKAIRTGEEVPPPRASAAPPDGGAAASGVDLDAELAALDDAPPPPRAATPPSGGGGGGGGAHFTESEAAAAAAKAAAASVPLQSWDDMPSAPAHAPEPPVAEPLPKIFSRGACLCPCLGAYAMLWYESAQHASRAPGSACPGRPFAAALQHARSVQRSRRAQARTSCSSATPLRCRKRGASSTRAPAPPPSPRTPPPPRRRPRSWRPTCPPGPRS